MTFEKKYLGQTGEELATAFLKEQGYRILVRNFKSRLGEMDIIAKDGDVICFIEVKTRTNNRLGTPFEAITPAKQRKLSQGALAYLKQNRLMDSLARFDVVSVMKGHNGSPKLEVLKNAFELSAPYAY